MSLELPAPGKPVTGREAVAFRPSKPTSRLIFRLWPNGPLQASEGAHLAAGPVTQGARTLQSHRPNPTTLVVRLGRTLAPGEVVRVSMPFTLRLPGPVLDRLSAGGGALRLGSFFPLLAWNPDTGWVTDPPTTLLGETSTSPTADFTVRIHAAGGTRVLATGKKSGPHLWRAEAVRDFALAAGRFKLAHEILHLPDPVRVTVGVDRSLGVTARAFLRKLESSLGHLATRYGPYPWPTFNLVIAPTLGGTGIEYPNMVFQGASSLARTTSHEAGHQWFYSLVGNDQATSPWLDESLASWVGAREDGDLPYFRSLRVPPDGKSHLTSGMHYWQRHSDRDYFAGVYTQGVQALAALGPVSKVDCALRYYAATNAYSIATPRDFVTAMSTIFPHAPRVLARYGIER